MYILFLLGIILPFQLALVPLYKVMKDTGLLGSYASMVLFYTGLQMPFTIFLYTGFLRALPREYGEAALVDGATHLQSFMRITFPLLRPITGTVIILNAVFVWNDFVTPLVYLGGTPNETIPVVVYQFVGQYVSNWGYVFAAVVLASLPILLVFLLHAALRDQGVRERTEGLIDPGGPPRRVAAGAAGAGRDPPTPRHDDTIHKPPAARYPEAGGLCPLTSGSASPIRRASSRRCRCGGGAATP